MEKKQIKTKKLYGRTIPSPVSLLRQLISPSSLLSIFTMYLSSPFPHFLPHELIVHFHPCCNQPTNNVCIALYFLSHSIGAEANAITVFCWLLFWNNIYYTCLHLNGPCHLFFKALISTSDKYIFFLRT